RQRYAFSRRNIRYASGTADALFARVARARVPASWKHTNAESRFPGDCVEQPASRSSPLGEPAAFRFILPAKHVSNRGAAASKTETGHPAADRRVRETVCSTARQTRARHFARSVSKITGLLVARKRSRTAKRDRICRGTGATRHDRRERAANRNTVASRAATSRDRRATADRRADSRRRRAKRDHSGACRMPRQQEKSSGTSRYPAPHAL